MAQVRDAEVAVGHAAAPGRQGFIGASAKADGRKALVSSRTHPKHQPAQAKGRDEVFIDAALTEAVHPTL
jgi:hypothetical protein